MFLQNVIVYEIEYITERNNVTSEVSIINYARQNSN